MILVISIIFRTFTILITYKTYTMKQIKKITQKERPGMTPFVIHKTHSQEDCFYFYEHFNNAIQIHELEQTAKGVYITLWICSKDVKMFLSNTEIEIEYCD